MGVDPVFDKMEDPVLNYPCLAGTGAGYDEQRPVGRCDSGKLRGIKELLQVCNSLGHRFSFYHFLRLFCGILYQK